MNQLIQGCKVNHAKAYGRIAFAVPKAQQEYIRKKIQDSNNKIITDLITLDTPGKASVQVMILADPVSKNSKQKLRSKIFLLE